ncbi:DUF5344 family protein [Bacillus vallismortis]|uniref:DUF5344 family protein n=1 Tax=Bacillus vallismortis TaxID=72361 RepID=UPI0010094E84|nr:DUF5344 family protein [Bacillus vallismortis]MBG9770914.1 hypothetical protein [Bacillus vallismortis]MEC1268238.1 DUF5344 family protein [Bacillus vallismortis]QAV10519.1 hypothetical protein BV11031_19170 [Bacillus vallismortis]
MSLEVKVKTDEVKQAISKLKGSNHGKSFNIPANISGQNHLDVLTKIESINKELEGLTKVYTSTLTKQSIQTEQAIEALQHTDETLASSIKTQ